MSGAVDALKAALGADKVVTDPAAMAERRHDYWVLSHLRDHVGHGPPAPLCLVRPATVADVQAVLRVANETGAPVIPFGLGSGVVGGVEASPEAIVLDMSAMAKVRSIDPVTLLASFDAGVNGLVAEQAAAEHGLTLGHWPQSIAVSSVGGWIATRASGQFSTANGNIEDIVHSIEAVLPTGEAVTLGRAPRAAAGPDLRHLLLGCEGTLGVITGVTLTARRAAEARAVSAFEAPTMRRGFDLQREIIQRGWRPAVARQYDARESARLDARASNCLMLFVHEGPTAMVEAERAAVGALASEAGVAPAPDDIVATWLQRRNHVPHWRDFFQRGVVLDTVEVSGSWRVIADIYDGVVASLLEMPGLLAGTAHSSHLYRNGLNLYFTFAVRCEGSPDGGVLSRWLATNHGGDRPPRRRPRSPPRRRTHPPPVAGARAGIRGADLAAPAETDARSERDNEPRRAAALTSAGWRARSGLERADASV